MDIFPAIDLRGGRVVRLTQGDYNKMTVYDADPATQAKEFFDAGARFLHVVDLDGAKDGTIANFETIKNIATTSGLYIEVGGGIRTEERIEQYLELGVSRCILGTVAVKDFNFTTNMIKKYGDKIAIGVDARDGYVATAGWLETSKEKGVEFCKRLFDVGCSAVIYTDIAKDGAMQGTNLPLYEQLAKEIPHLAITASGGICSMEEMRVLKSYGTKAAILGKSLYAGALNLNEVINAFQ